MRNGTRLLVIACMWAALAMLAANDAQAGKKHRGYSYRCAPVCCYYGGPVYSSGYRGVYSSGYRGVPVYGTYYGTYAPMYSSGYRRYYGGPGWGGWVYW